MKLKAARWDPTPSARARGVCYFLRSVRCPLRGPASKTQGLACVCYLFWWRVRDSLRGSAWSMCARICLHRRPACREIAAQRSRAQRTCVQNLPKQTCQEQVAQTACAEKLASRTRAEKPEHLRTLSRRLAQRNLQSKLAQSLLACRTCTQSLRRETCAEILSKLWLEGMFSCLKDKRRRRKNMCCNTSPKPCKHRSA